MKILRTLVFIIAFVHFNLFSQDLRRDTIQLQNINIKAKELQYKSFKFGKGPGLGTYAYFDNDTTAYLIEDIPYGEISEITIYFRNVNDNAVPKIKHTTYELSLYDVSNNNVGPLINKTPITVDLNESKKSFQKKVIDLSHLSFKSSRFFIFIKRTSELPCRKCAMYVPTVYDSKKKQWFYGDLTILKTNDYLQPKLSGYNMGLRCEIKTLTRDY
jgi:hypothetical protein